MAMAYVYMYQHYCQFLQGAQDQVRLLVLLIAVLYERKKVCKKTVVVIQCNAIMTSYTQY